MLIFSGVEAALLHLKIKNKKFKLLKPMVATCPVMVAATAFPARTI